MGKQTKVVRKPRKPCQLKLPWFDLDAAHTDSTFRPFKIFAADHPLVRDGTYDVYGFKKAERKRYDRLHPGWDDDDQHGDGTGIPAGSPDT